MDLGSATIAVVAQGERAVAARLVVHLDHVVPMGERDPLGRQPPVRQPLGTVASTAACARFSPCSQRAARVADRSSSPVGEHERGGRRNAVDEVGGRVAGQEAGMAQRGGEEVAVRRDAAEVEALQRQREARGRLGARGSVGDHLGEHRVEVDAHDRAGLDARVPPDGGVGSRLEGGERAGGRQEAGGRDPRRRAGPRWRGHGTRWRPGRSRAARRRRRAAARGRGRCP